MRCSYFINQVNRESSELKTVLQVRASVLTTGKQRRWASRFPALPRWGLAQGSHTPESPPALARHGLHPRNPRTAPGWSAR